MNTPSIIVIGIVAVVFIAIVIKLIIDKKKGKNGCAGGCDGCSMKGFCDKK